MRICFIDTVVAEYRADTPYHAPLGGTQAAACYLAEALATRGHDVAMWTKTSQPGRVNGVTCVNLHGLPADTRVDYDVVVLMSSVNSFSVDFLRSFFPSRTRFALWIQHADDQPGPRGLADPQVAAFFDAIILVSGWQARRYQEAFKLRGESIHIMRNAAAPAFTQLFADGEAVLPHKGDAACMAYASAPHRGLDLAVEAFVRLRRLVPDAVFAAYCGPSVDDPAQIEADPYFSRLRRLDGVVHVGSLPQPRLAEGLKRAAALFYPNTFAETSCVTALEAMAAGCRIITSNLGALPETTAPWGVLRAPFDGGDRNAYLEDFAAAAAAEIAFLRENPDEAEAVLRAQTDMSAHNRWSVRAGQWERLFRRMTTTAATLR